MRGALAARVQACEEVDVGCQGLLVGGARVQGEAGEGGVQEMPGGVAEGGSVEGWVS